MRPYHICISCFDISADHHAARLLSYLEQVWQRRGGVVWSVIGGEALTKLAAAHDNVHFLKESVLGSSIGLLEGLREALKTPVFLRRMRAFLKSGIWHAAGPVQKGKGSAADSWGKVDLLLSLDGQGINLILGKMAQRLDIRTAYLFPPLVFVWGAWNTKKLIHYDRVFCVFKPNWEFYKMRGVAATYMGHPFVYYRLAEEAAQLRQGRVSAPLRALLQQYSLRQRVRTLKRTLKLSTDEYVIGLFPGSRFQELRALAPLFFHVAARLLKHYSAARASQFAVGTKRVKLRFVLALAHREYLPMLEQWRAAAGLTAAELPIMHNAYEEILASSHLALTCSGTITFKAAYFGTPHIVTYKISWLSYWLARLLINTSYISMLNIMSKRSVVLELINRALSKQSLYTATKAYLDAPEQLRAKRTELLSLTSALGKPSLTEHPFGKLQTELETLMAASRVKD